MSTIRITTTEQRWNSIRGAVFHLNFELTPISKHTSKSMYNGSWLVSGEAKDMCFNHSQTQMVDIDQKVTGCTRWKKGETPVCVQTAEKVTESHRYALCPGHGRLNTDHFLNKHTGCLHEISGGVLYLLVGPVLWLEIAARLFKPQVKVGKSVEKVHPPWRRVAHHRRHGEQMSKDSTHHQQGCFKLSTKESLLQTHRPHHEWKR